MSIQVKTRRTGSWHTSIEEGKLSPSDPDEVHFWVFVDLGDYSTLPSYYVVPDWWIRKDIYEVHNAYLKRHEGKRPQNPESKHHGISEDRLAQWKDQWDLLKLF